MNDGPSGMLVVGVDGSAPAQQGLTLAVSFAIQNRIGVHSVAVGAPCQRLRSSAFPHRLARWRSTWARRQNEMLESEVQRAKPDGEVLVVQKSVAYGDPVVH